MTFRVGRVAITAVLCTPLLSCTTPPTDRVDRALMATEGIDSARRRLEAIAELEAFEPRTGSFAAAAARIDPTMPKPITPGSIGYADATVPLDEVLEVLRPGTPIGALPTPSSENARQAASLYAAARSAKLSDDAAKAAEMLDRAVDLDPSSAVLWNELGEARYMIGDRVGAVDAWQAAAELGGTSIRPLLLLASDASQRGEVDDTVRWSGAAWSRAEHAPDRLLAGSILGAALVDRGSLRAGAEVLEQTLQELGQHAPVPGEPTELTRLRTRVPELAMRLGDAWLRLAQPARAADGYAMGMPNGGRVSVPMLQRTLAARVLAGQPATASTLLLEHLQSNAGDLAAEETQWLAGCAGLAGVGPAVIAAAESLLEVPTYTETQRRQILRTVIGATLSDEDAASTAMRRLTLMANPVLVGDLLMRFDPETRESLTLKAVAREPRFVRAWAAALARLDTSPRALADRLISAGEPADRTLGIAIAAEYQLRMTPPTDAASETPINAVMLAELAGRSGRWDEAARLLSRSVPAPRPDRIAALIACQRLQDARQLAREIDDDPVATVDDLLASAEVAFLSGDTDTAAHRVIRASEIDPFDERVWERRIALVSGGDATPERVRAVGRALSEQRGRSALFGLLRARDLAGQSRFRDACELIMLLNEREPSRDLGLAMLAQFSTAGSEQDPGLADRVADWLAARLRSVPGSVPNAVALAETLTPSNPSRALEVLDRSHRTTGHPEIARAAELLLMSHPDLGERAEDRVLDRTEGPIGVDASLERVEACLRLGRWSEAVETTLNAIPPEGELTLQQAEQWRAAAGALSRLPEDRGVLERVLAVYDAGEARALLDDSLERQRTLVLARLGRTNRLEALVRNGSLGSDSGVIVVQALLAAGRQPDAIDLLGNLAIQADHPDAELLSEWARLAGAAGDADRVRAMLAHIDDRARPALLAEVSKTLREAFGFNESPGEANDARHRADIAYAAALVANVFNRVPESEAMYQLALEHDPSHAWACNDLGYALADRGESLGEAEELIQRAAEALPQQASILDSLGWVRYKLGVFLDEVGPDGSVKREGAVTILTRALAAENGEENATLHEHLGDALARAGRLEQAAASWRSAEALLRKRAMELAAQPQPNQSRIAETQDRLNQIRRRLEALEQGQEPPLAPLGTAPDPG
ncbi:MAG: tetratricopeptide repeat protein [Planctomycetota bacterium]|nr:MAG: tetratricopeptide repeat protein [Planctomycetota bacterium]